MTLANLENAFEWLLIFFIVGYGAIIAISFNPKRFNNGSRALHGLLWLLKWLMIPSCLLGWWYYDMHVFVWPPYQAIKLVFAAACTIGLYYSIGLCIGMLLQIVLHILGVIFRRRTS